MASTRFRKITSATPSGRFIASKGGTGCDPSPYSEEILAAKITPAMLQFLPTEILNQIEEWRADVNSKYDKSEKKRYD